MDSFSFLPEINQKALSLSPPDAIVHSRVEPDRKILEFFAKNLFPLVYKPAIKAFNKTEDKIVDFLRNQEVEVRTGDYADPLKYASADRSVQKVIFKDWYSEIHTNTFAVSKGYPPYLGNYKIDNNDLEKIGLDFPSYFPKEYYRKPSLWIGPKGCVTPIHQDGLDNIVYQLKGEKRWILIHPCFYERLKIRQPFPEQYPNIFTSDIDINTLFKYEQKDLKYLELTLREGECLFLPAGWFHYVESCSLSFTVNFWINPEYQVPLFLKP